MKTIDTTRECPIAPSVLAILAGGGAVVWMLYLGKETFKDRLLKLFDPSSGNAPSGRTRSGGEMRDYGEKEAARILREGMKALGVPSAKGALSALIKSDERKIVLAGILRAKTSVSNEWIASKLMMGHPGSVSLMLSAGRADKELAIKRHALVQLIFPHEQATQ